MNNVIIQMLNGYNINNTDDEINALKEIIQELVLLGLSRGNFFKEAAFYGGTSLRIFYNLDRFSEDLDFALITPNSNFDLTKYFEYIEKELRAYGLNLKVNIKEKNSKTNIASGIVQGNTLEHILKFFPNEEKHEYDYLLKDLKIKFEVDVNPPLGATCDVKYKLLPSPHQIRVYDRKSLFASKIHAILCRNWNARIKGRDLYDYVFFLASGTSVNLDLLKNKLIASNYIDDNSEFNIDILKKLLIKRFNTIDFKEAKEDVLPFIKDVYNIDIWNNEFFISITENLK